MQPVNAMQLAMFAVIKFVIQDVIELEYSLQRIFLRSV